MNETIRDLMDRKSCRSYKKEHISRAELDAILTAGLNAPTGMNRQTPIFVAVQDAETVALLSRLNAAVMGTDSDPFYGAQDVVIVLVRREGTYIYDGSLAMGNLMNAAHSLGIASCWIHRAKEVFASGEGKQLLQKWGVTADVEGIGFCILGRAADDKPKHGINPDRVVYIG